MSSLASSHTCLLARTHARPSARALACQHTNSLAHPLTRTPARQHASSLPHPLARTLARPLASTLAARSPARSRSCSLVRPPTRPPARLLVRPLARMAARSHTSLLARSPARPPDRSLACPPARSPARPPASSPARSHTCSIARQQAHTSYPGCFDNNDADTQLWHSETDWSWLLWSLEPFRRRSTSATSNLGLVPSGLELACTTAASASGQWCSRRKINCTQIHGILAGYSQFNSGTLIYAVFTQYLSSIYSRNYAVFTHDLRHICT